MSEIGPPQPMRKADLRWTLVTVSAIALIGLISAKLGEPGLGDVWFDRLIKPSFMPPRWAYGAMSSTLYILTGAAFALVLSVREAPGRSMAILLFLVQLGFHLAWPLVFFAQHRIMLGLGLLLATLLWACLTTLVFWRIRRVAALLMLPYLAWVLFAAYVSWQVHTLNPYGLTLVPSTGDTQIIIQ
jgi:translocator protein